MESYDNKIVWVSRLKKSGVSKTVSCVLDTTQSFGLCSCVRGHRLPDLAFEYAHPYHAWSTVFAYECNMNFTPYKFVSFSLNCEARRSWSGVEFIRGL